MHILLVHQAFAAVDEPGATRHYELASHLAAQGHQVTILAGQVSYLSGSRIAGGWVQREQPSPGLAILRCYTASGWHQSFARRVVSFFSFMGSSLVIGLGVDYVDLVWGTSPPIFQGISAWALARAKRVPFVFEVRDLWPSFAVAAGVLKNRLLIGLSRRLERFLYRRGRLGGVKLPR